MKNSAIVWIVLIIIVLVGGGWYWYANNGAAAATPTDQTTNPNPAAPTEATPGTAQTVTVLYGPNGFSPSTVTINKGDTVTFTNNGGDDMWVASNPHPTHQGYDGTTESQHCATGYTGAPPFDECSSSVTFSFMFNQVGTWGYHNHDNHDMTGTIIVQ